jgi:protein-S-isoprenylcysteine O-methyltransferase Ste14
MARDADDAVTFRLWPPVAIGAPLLAGWLVTRFWGDPVALGAWRIPVGWVLVALFAAWDGWALWLFARNRTGLLPGQATTTIVQRGPYRLSRNPLYIGLLALYVGAALLAPTFWGLVLLPVAIVLILWGAIIPEEKFLHERFGGEYDQYTQRVRRWL